jgi:hypothetical protein
MAERKLIDAPGRARWLAHACGAGVLLAAFAYVLLWVNPATLYHSQQRAAFFPIFFTGRAFAGPFMHRPGGPVEYAAAFLSQLYYVPALGTAAIVLLAGLLAVCSHGYLRRVLGEPPRTAHLVPLICAILPLSRFCNPLPEALAVLAACAAAWAYALVGAARPRLRAPAFIALMAVCHWAAGGAVLLFAVLCGLYEAVAPRGYVAAAACLIVGAACPIVGARAAGIPESWAYLVLTPAAPRTDPAGRALAAALFASLPLALAGALLWRSAMRRTEAGPARAAAASAAILAAGALAVCISAGSAERTKIRMEYFAALGRWEDALNEASKLDWRQFDRPMVWEVNRLLAHAGRLGDLMFGYVQAPDRLMPLPSDFAPGRVSALPARRRAYAFQKCADVMYDLGRLNEAELMAHEAWEIVAPRPEILQKLAYVTMAKHQPELAGRFLHKLAGHLWMGCWAEEMLRRLDAAPEMSSDPEVARLRAQAATVDTIGEPTGDTVLRQQLDQDPGNRMAYDYLMAYCLLTRNLSGVAALAPRLPSMGYKRIPRHWEEALIVRRRLGGAPVEIPGLAISEETVRSVADFSQRLATFGRDLQSARLALIGDYRDTYVFYLAFAGGTGG